MDESTPKTSTPENTEPSESTSPQDAALTGNEKETSPMPKRKKVARKKKATEEKTEQEVVKRGPGRPRKKAPGRPRKVAAKRGPGRPPKKKAGRPRKTGLGRPRKETTVREAPVNKEMIELPINAQTGVDFWSNMVKYLNDNQGKSFIIQLDGKTFALGAM